MQRQAAAPTPFRVLHITNTASATVSGITLAYGMLNAAGAHGGGVLIDGGTNRIVDCVILGNRCNNGDGGGLYKAGGSLRIERSTITQNASFSGGAMAVTGAGVYVAGAAQLRNATITNCRITDPNNLSGCGGVRVAGIASCILANTLVADNVGLGSPDVGGAFTDQGGNLVRIATGGTGFATSTLLGTAASPVEPMLGLPANNGGPTRTRALLPGSPAVNAGLLSNVPADVADADNDTNVAEPVPYDQRGAGFIRAIGNPDIGSFEVQKAVSIANLAATNEGNSGTTNFTFTVNRIGDTAGAVTMTYTVGGAAVNAADFAGGTLPTGNVTIPDGQASTTLTIPVNGDLAAELDEAFTVTLSAPDNGYVVAGDPASTTITNDDTLSVTINQAIAQADPTNASTVNFTVVFSEPVTGFATGDVTVGGSALPTTGMVTESAPNDGTSYNVAVSGMTLSGTVTASVPATVALSAGGAGNAASTSTDNTVTLDITPPALASAIAINDTALKIGDTATVTFLFTEAVTGFTTADVSATNAGLSSLSSADGGITWTATLTPASDIEDSTNLLTLDLTGIVDAAGNTGTGTVDSPNYSIDTLRPTVAIVVADSALTIGESSLVTITFSEPVTGFTNADLSVANGMLTSVSSSDGGTTFTATFTPDNVIDPTNVITLDKSGVTDMAGNTGSGSTDSNNYAIDITTVSIAATDADADENTSGTGTWRVTRNGSSGDLTVHLAIDPGSTAVAADWTQSGASFASLAPGGTGTIVIPDGQSFAEITMTPSSDIHAEAAESVRLNVTADAAYVLLAPTDATVTIGANDFVVINTNDAGEGSLRQAVANANAIAGADTITFAGTVFTDATTPDGIALTSGQLELSSDIQILGAGANELHVSGGGASRVFQIPNVSATVTLDGLTVRDGNADYGGGIRSASPGTLIVHRCVFSGNRASTQGGGIGTQVGAFRLVNSTITANHAVANGGGMYIPPNLAPVELGNNIIAGNTAGFSADVHNDDAGNVSTLGGNLISDFGSYTSMFATGSPNAQGDFIGSTAAPIDPKLGPLADNGGTTPTHALLPGSPAVNIGVNANLPQDTFDIDGDSNTTETIPFDQALQPRVYDNPTLATDKVDSGAFESQNSPPTVVAPGIADVAKIEDDPAFTIDLTPHFADAEQASGTLIYEVTGNSNPSLVSVAITGGTNVEITPQPDQTGFADITIRATDDGNLTVEDTFRVTITKQVDLVATVVESVDPVLAGVGVPGNLTHQIQVFNNGPSDATNITVNVAQTLPAGVTLVSADPLSGSLVGGVWTIPVIADNAMQTLTLTMTVAANTAAGTDSISTTGTVGSVTEPIVATSNDTDTERTSVISASAMPLGLTTGLTGNFQNGLIEQKIRVTNNNTGPVPAFRVVITGLPADVTVFNNQGTTSGGAPYILWNQPLAGNGGIANLLVQFHRANGIANFTPIYTIELLGAPVTAPLPGGATELAISRTLRRPDGSFLIEWTSVPGRSYRVRWSSDMTTWHDVLPDVKAVANQTQWIDAGPPQTTSHPSTAGSRFYQIHLLP